MLHEGEVELKLETDGVHIYTQDGKKVLSELFVGGARGDALWCSPNALHYGGT